MIDPSSKPVPPRNTPFVDQYFINEVGIVGIVEDVSPNVHNGKWYVTVVWHTLRGNIKTINTLDEFLDGRNLPIRKPDYCIHTREFERVVDTAYMRRLGIPTRKNP